MCPTYLNLTAVSACTCSRWSHTGSIYCRDQNYDMPINYLPYVFEKTFSAEIKRRADNRVHCTAYVPPRQI
jgi:hypothetical protein